MPIRNVLGVVASGFLFNGHPSPTTVADVKDINHQLESRLITVGKNDFNFKNFTGNINWKHSFDSAGRELTADFDYVRYSTVTEMGLATDIYNNALQYQAQYGLTWPYSFRNRYLFFQGRLYPAL